MIETFFDTETTGLDNPYPVQLAFIVEKDGRVINTTNVLVNCGVSIEPGAAQVHGFTDEMIRDLGVTPSKAFEMWADFTRNTDTFVAHNIFFDAKANRNLFRLCGEDLYADTWKELLKINSYCTMLKSTNICRLPKPSGRGGYKWPKLVEAHLHFFGEEFEGAHDALIDVYACRRVYRKMKELGIG